ncbi:hypothetical protein Plhal304r1_c058g0144411 [Plasmopara halstedii]
MGKSSDRHIASEGEFFKLGEVLEKTAKDTSTCLKLLKTHLSEYDSRNGNHFINTASSYMRSDMRTAKDMASELTHVGHRIASNHKPNKSEILSARNMKEATTKAIDSLKISARNYDRENGQRMGVKGTIDAVVGGHSDNKVEREGGLFNNMHGHETTNHHKGMFQTKDDNGGGIMGSSETVETLVTKILRDHFDLSALEYQITAAEKSLSPSIVERAKEKIHDVKEKLTGDHTDGHVHHYGGHHSHNKTVSP